MIATRHTVAVSCGSYLGFDMSSALANGLGVMFGGEASRAVMSGASKWYNESRAFEGYCPGAIG